MFLGLVALLAVVIAIVVWGVVVHKWVTASCAQLFERSQRKWLFIPTYVLVIAAAALIGFLASEILQGSPAPSTSSALQGTMCIVRRADINDRLERLDETMSLLRRSEQGLTKFLEAISTE